MLGEKIGEISGKITMQRVLPNLGRYPKMETSFQATGSVLGTNVNDTGTYWTVLPYRRDPIQRRPGCDGDQGRRNGDMDGPRCRRKEQRRDRDLSRRALFPNHAAKMVASEQGRGSIRIRGRCGGQYTLRVLGMEVVCSDHCELGGVAKFPHGDFHSSLRSEPRFRQRRSAPPR